MKENIELQQRWPEQSQQSASSDRDRTALARVGKKETMKVRVSSALLSNLAKCELEKLRFIIYAWLWLYCSEHLGRSSVAFCIGVSERRSIWSTLRLHDHLVRNTMHLYFVIRARFNGSNQRRPVLLVRDAWPAKIQKITQLYHRVAHSMRLAGWSYFCISTYWNYAARTCRAEYANLCSSCMACATYNVRHYGICSRLQHVG